MTWNYPLEVNFILCFAHYALLSHAVLLSGDRPTHRCSLLVPLYRSRIVQTSSLESPSLTTDLKQATSFQNTFQWNRHSGFTACVTF